MIRRSVTASALVLALATLAGTASAQRWDGNDNRYADGPIWDTARVLSVDPILAPSSPAYRQQCWQEPVRYVETVRDSRRFRDDGRQWRTNSGVGQNTGTVLGGIVGAALGNQVGDGDGRRAATVAGALLGGAIARDNLRGRDSGYGNSGYGYDNRGHGGYGYDDRGYDSRRGGVYQRETVRYEQRCRTVSDYRQDDRVVGYQVTYDYNGRQFTTQTDRHPGRSIRVRVDVTPEG